MMMMNKDSLPMKYSDDSKYERQMQKNDYREADCQSDNVASKGRCCRRGCHDIGAMSH